MSIPELVYRNRSAEAMTWAADVQARHEQIVKDRLAWMDAMYEDAGVPADHPDRGAYFGGHVYTHQLTGLAWPADAPLPRGWYRPVKSPELIRPRASSQKQLQTLTRYSQPDQRAELSDQLGMRGRAFAGLSYLACGVRLEKDAVWVFWGTAAVAPEVEPRALEYGWERVPLRDVLQRFTEEELATF